MVLFVSVSCVSYIYEPGSSCPIQIAFKEVISHPTLPNAVLNSQSFLHLK